jgi:hypothetical protein
MNRYCIYIFLLFIPMISFGQLQLGVKGGYSYFWFCNYEEGGPYSLHFTYPNNSYLIAIAARQRSEHKFNLGMELQYVHRSFGVKARNEFHMSSSKVDMNFTVGSLLVQIQPQFVFGSNVKFFLYPGCYFGAILHSTIIHGSAERYSNGIEFGISQGIGIEFPFYKYLNFVAEYNFNIGLNSVGNSWGNPANMLSMNFEVGVVYTLRGGSQKIKIEPPRLGDGGLGVSASPRLEFVSTP